MRFAIALITVFLLVGCAPQLDRIETAVRQNRDAIDRLDAETQQVRRELQALEALLRLDQDQGQESQAQRLARMSQLSTRIEQLIRQLDDNMQFMRTISARIDMS